MNAYFAGGCFWCMEKPYHTIPGVQSAVSGYSIREPNRSPAVAVEPFTVFWPAEEYHQRYAEKHPEAYAEEYELSGRKAFHEQRES